MTYVTGLIVGGPASGEALTVTYELARHGLHLTHRTDGAWADARDALAQVPTVVVRYRWERFIVAAYTVNLLVHPDVDPTTMPEAVLSALLTPAALSAVVETP